MQEHNKDNIFLRDNVAKFEFNELVASVFDDMIERSIPFYDEVMKLSIFFIMQKLHIKSTTHKDSNIIYDLGSSTGNLLLLLDDTLKKENIKARLYGIDNSLAMIERARLKSCAMNSSIEFIHNDFLSIDFKKADIFLSFYTMQFVRPLQREEIIQKIYNSLKDNGIFLFAEKVISQDCEFETQMIACYYDYKTKQGYTQNEIYKKREALENVLVPYSVDENCKMLYKSGFKHVEILFKWVNFTLFIAKK